MVISLVNMLRPVMASEKPSQSVGSSGVSKSQSLQGTFVSLTPAPTQQLLGRQGSRAGGRALCSSRPPSEGEISEGRGKGKRKTRLRRGHRHWKEENALILFGVSCKCRFEEGWLDSRLQVLLVGAVTALFSSGGSRSLCAAVSQGSALGLPRFSVCSFPWRAAGGS